MRKTRFSPRGEKRMPRFVWAIECMRENELLKQKMLGGLR